MTSDSFRPVRFSIPLLRLNIRSSLSTVNTPSARLLIIESILFFSCESIILLFSRDSITLITSLIGLKFSIMPSMLPPSSFKGATLRHTGIEELSFLYRFIFMKWRGAWLQLSWLLTPVKSKGQPFEQRSVLITSLQNTPSVFFPLRPMSSFAILFIKRIFLSRPITTIPSAILSRIDG